MRRLIVFILIIGLAGLAGCGKKELPPPPVAHVLLVTKLFNNLSKNQHDAAYKRVQKVRALDPANEFLIQLEEREFCNHHIQQAQALLDTGKILQAIGVVNTALGKFPLNRNLLAIHAELAKLENLQKHIRLLNSATSSREMNSQIDAIILFIRNCPSAKVLQPLLRPKVLLALKTKLHEQERARFDLLCDLKAARQAKHPDQSFNDTLSAMLTVANAAAVNKNERVSPGLLE